ncbi:MAG: outer membrane protein assembly factor BamB family protein, partial [Desulfocucumaceae bacterium]
MKKYSLLLIFMVALMIYSCIPAQAATSDEVWTFGSTDERNRDNSVEGRVLYLMYVHEAGGASFSQPLILDGRHWGGELDMVGKQLVITVENNRLNGYVMCGLLSGELLEQNMKTIDPDWSIPLSGLAPTKSHPTFYETPDGKKYIFIGAYGPYLDIVDITDFKKARLYKSRDLLHTTDVTSAPLVMDWKGHMVVVATSGNTAKVVLLVDPLEEGDNSVSFYIDAGSGRTSSSPAPLDLDGDGKYESFAVGLDQGTSRGELRIYNLNNILGIGKNGQVVQTGQSAEDVTPLMGGLVGSFSVDKNNLYFGDCRSQVYGYDVVNKRFLLRNNALKGVFSNRSPALTSNRVYFPAVGRKGEQGSLIAISRSTGKTEWIKQFLTNAQTAPVVIRSADGGAGILMGTSKHGQENSYVAMLNPSDGTTVSAQEVFFMSGEGGTEYASGVAGELGASKDTLAAATDGGIYIWRLLHTLDLEAVDLDTGVEGKAEPGKTYHGSFKIKFSGKIKADTPFKLSAAGVGVLVNDKPAENLTINGKPLP